MSARLLAKRTSHLHPNGVPSPAAGSLIETVAGAVPYQNLPANALQVGLGDGQGIAEDASGNLYVATGSLGVVLKVDTSSNVTIYAGQPLATGPAVQSGDGGPATAARLPYPNSLAVDSAGNLYISDLLSYTVRVVNAATGVIQTVAGTPGQYGLSGDGGPALAATLQLPQSLALDGNGNLFIADPEYVREVNLASGVIQTIAGSGNDQSPCNLSNSNSCPATGLYMDIYGPSTLAVSGSTLYVVAQYLQGTTGPGESTNGMVAIDLTTGNATLVAGYQQPAGSSTNPAIGAQLFPNGVAVDAQGNIDFTDGGGYVWSLSASRLVLTALAGTGDIGFSGDSGPATAAVFGNPQAIVLSPTGAVVIRDQNRVRSFPVGGNIGTIAGNGSANFFGDNGPGTLAGLSLPSGVATDAQGNIYIADQNDFVVRRLDAATGVITTVAGNGNNPYSSSTSVSSTALQSTISPRSLALDQAGNLYIADQYSGALLVVNQKTGALSTLFQAGMSGGQGGISGGMAFDGNKTLYVPTYNNQIQAIDVTSGSATTVAGSPGNYAASGDGGPALQAGIGIVNGVALDNQGNLYLSDYANSVIRVVNLSTGIIRTLAGQAGMYGYTGDGGPAAAATLSSPLSIGYDGAGHLNIDDNGNSVIRQIDLTTGVITTLAGSGSTGFSGDGSAAGSALLFDPIGLATDPSGNLFIADSENDRVRRVLIHPTTLTASLTASASSVTAGANVTFAATFTGLSLGIAPTGTVTLFNGTTALGSATLVAPTDGSTNYTAAFSTTAVPAGAANITAQYAGDAHYASVTTPAVTVTVAAPVAPSYTVAAAPNTLSIKQGASGSTVFTVTPAGGFNQAIGFACDSTTLPQGVTCGFIPASVTPDGTHTITSTLTVQTTGATAALDLQKKPQSRWWIPSGGGVLALLLCGLPRRRTWRGWMAVVAFAICLSGTIGCSAIDKALNGENGSGGSSGSGSTSNATPAGTYTIKVAATSGTGSSAVSQPLSVTVTVTQ